VWSANFSTPPVRRVSLLASEEVNSVSEVSHETTIRSPPKRRDIGEARESIPGVQRARVLDRLLPGVPHRAACETCRTTNLPRPHRRDEPA